jgi:hypothetical protein
MSPHLPTRVVELGADDFESIMAGIAQAMARYPHEYIHLTITPRIEQAQTMGNEIHDIMFGYHATLTLTFDDTEEGQ